MPGASRVGVDSAGGIITGPGIASVIVNGSPISVIGDSVTPHITGPHLSAKMVGGSSSVFAGGVGVVRAGDAASCGDTASGSSDVICG
jgi:uncharacterized Zn-binding protein involved in type VI secretion